MTLLDAVLLSHLALIDRRLVTALLRTLVGRDAEDDRQRLPPRNPAEPVLEWCRRAAAQRPESLARLERAQADAARSLDRASHEAITPIPLGDARYSQRLSTISDPPPVLWTLGQPGAWARPAVAVVGSRAATSHALGVARQLAEGLSRAGITVVSGLARGVDSAAHAAVVSVSGCTVGVLGCGVDRIYPAENKRLAADMLAAGALVSEFPPGIAPQKHHFPLRNRLISGLSQAIVVVEAPEKSGALITASTAAEQGREVLVVPSHVTGGRNRGAHLLIRDGARLVESAQDVLDDLGLLPSTEAVPPRPAPIPWIPTTADFSLDEITEWSGLAPSAALGRLLELELAGQIQRVGGGRFARVLT